MNANLIVGLGNALMGDEGVGCHVAERLATDRRLPADTDVLCGGTDLLRCAGYLENRQLVILVDAMLGDSDPGTISVFDGDFPDLQEREQHVHHLSLQASIRLLRIAAPSFRAVRLVLVAVSIASAEFGWELSPALEKRMPEMLGAVLQELQRRKQVRWVA